MNARIATGKGYTVQGEPRINAIPVIDHGKKCANGRVYINGIEGFQSLAKRRLLKYHGVDAQKFPLRLKELEFWYTHRDRDIFDDPVQV